MRNELLKVVVACGHFKKTIIEFQRFIKRESF